jgi:adenosine deaminase
MLNQHTEIKKVAKFTFVFTLIRYTIPLQSDDKGVFSTTLSEEYYLAAQTFHLDKQELWELSLAAVDHIFEDDTTKEDIRKCWTQQTHPLSCDLK